MKSIILTNAPTTAQEKKVLINTKIFKLALNQHCSELSPDERIITDYVLSNIYKDFSEPIVSVRDRLRTPDSRVKYFDGEFKGATIISAIEYLISLSYDEILIVGNNKVNGTKFQNLINENIEELKNKVKLYQYSNGNFNLGVKSILEFCGVK